MDWAVARPEFKVPLFRFIDALPACRTDRDVLDHLDGYLDGPESPWPRPGRPARRRRRAGRGPPRQRGGPRRRAPHGDAGSSPARAPTTPPRALEALWRDGFAATVDLLGEKTAHRRRRRPLRRAGGGGARPPSPRRRRAGPRTRRLQADPWGALPQVHVSIKATALAPLLTPYTQREGIDEAMSRLGPILDHAVRRGATIHLDSEHDEVKDATFALLREIGAAYPDGPQLGCVVQAYRTDAYDDLRGLIDWSAATLRRPLQVRLVKGAYWDAETITARAHRWAPPVWPDKADSDANYERCARLLVERAGDVRPAFASHNLRSLAYALAAAAARRAARRAPSSARSSTAWPRRCTAPCATSATGPGSTCPIGELVPGMAYLVRRLLENTSNESFVRMLLRRRQRPRRPRSPRPTSALDAAAGARRRADRRRRSRALRERARRRAAPGRRCASDSCGAVTRHRDRLRRPRPHRRRRAGRRRARSCRSTRAAPTSRSAGPRWPTPADAERAVERRPRRLRRRGRPGRRASGPAVLFRRRRRAAPPARRLRRA